MKCYCGCNRPAVRKVMNYPLCDICYQQHIIRNRQVLEFLRKNKTYYNTCQKSK
jgi:hypothetical protein